MTHVDGFVAGAVLQGLSGVVIAALGFWVATLRPRTPASRAFALFAVGFGGYFATSNFGSIAHLDPGAHDLLRFVPRLLWLVGLALLAARFPYPLRRDERSALAAAGLVASVVGGTLLLTYRENGLLTGPIGYVFYPVDAISLGGLWGYSLLLALRYPRASSKRERDALALTSSALLCYVAFASGSGLNAGHGLSLVTETAGLAQATAAAMAACVLLVAVAWLVGTRGADGATARNLALLALGLLLVGFLAAATDTAYGELGIARLSLAVLLAYAILRHQLLGLDVKVRWTIRQSTIGAAFIAVFFIVSEGASVFFGSDNAYLGVLAAGALVFALAPLQRVAERVAHAAVPVATAERAAPVADARALLVYERAVRAAIEDGAMTAGEEEHLAHIAHALEIPQPDALRVRREVEAAGGRS